MLPPPAVYVTACDLAKPFSFNMIIEIAGHMRFPIHVYAIFSKVWKLERFQMAEMTFSVTQGHW